MKCYLYEHPADGFHYVSNVYPQYPVLQEFEAEPVSDTPPLLEYKKGLIELGETFYLDSGTKVPLTRTA